MNLALKPIAFNILSAVAATNRTGSIYAERIIVKYPQPNLRIDAKKFILIREKKRYSKKNNIIKGKMKMAAKA